MTDSQVVEILKNFNLSYDNLLLNLFRWLGWIIIKGLAKLCGFLENAISSVFSYLNFAQIPQIQDFINTFRPVLWALLMISVIFIGINYTINRKFSLQGITINILIVIVVFSSLTLGMDKLNEFTQASVESIYSTNNNKSMADNLVKNSITDVLLWDQNNFTSKDIPQPNNISILDISYIDINEVIDDDTAVNNEKVFENKIGINVDGVTTLQPLSGGWFSWDEQYYRYQFSFGFSFIALLVMAIVTILVGIKAGRLIYEIVFGQLLVLIFSAVDISSGQRTKKAIQYTMSCFFVIIFMVISLKIYSIFVPWISSKGGAGAILALIGFSWGVIDGPNIVQQLIGIDAGLSSAWRTAIGLGAVGKGITKMGGKIGSSVKSHIQNRSNTSGNKTDNINQANNTNSKESDSNIFNNKGTKDSSNNEINKNNNLNNSTTKDNPKVSDNMSNLNRDNNKNNTNLNSDEKISSKNADSDLNKKVDKESNSQINANKNNDLNNSKIKDDLKTKDNPKVSDNMSNLNRDNNKNNTNLNSDEKISSKNADSDLNKKSGKEINNQMNKIMPNNKVNNNIESKQKPKINSNSNLNNVHNINKSNSTEKIKKHNKIKKKGGK